MSMTDPIADFLTRIRNGLHAGHDEVLIPHSKMKAEMARILQEQGYIVGWSVERARVGEVLTDLFKANHANTTLLVDWSGELINWKDTESPCFLLPGFGNLA